MSSNMNSGYKGYSMSVRACRAYENNEKPLSKWTKAEILDALQNVGVEDIRLSKYCKQALASCFLFKSSWHHTSSKLNRTDFYSIDMESVEGYLEDPTASYEYLDEKEKEIKSIKSSKCNDKLEIVDIEFGEWEGTKKYPKLVIKQALGVKKGHWVWIDINTKKSLTGKHCKIIKTYHCAPKGKAKVLNAIKKELMK